MAATLLLAAAPGRTQTSEPEVVSDPPGRVARLSYLDGEVSIAPAGEDEWDEAVLNRPLTSDDRVWVDQDGRAELEIGSATIHLDESTALGFIQLDDDVMQVSVTQGAASIRVRRLGERETIQVETPNATVLLRRPGEYSFEVDPERDRTVVKTRSGEADVIDGSRTHRVAANREGVFTGLENMQADVGSLPSRTDFEDWANERNRRHEQSQSARYVSTDVVGYEDLDDHGEWIHERDYGYVWRPTYVVHDWAPYRYGRWVWVRPWGWTWIDDARWGFAPSHYGRWVHLHQRWCWVPGPRYVRPVYAPALVGWVGSPSLTISMSFGSGVGWFPLAPREVYFPYYRHTPRYNRYVNISNTIVNYTEINNLTLKRGHVPKYTYREVNDAVTVVPRNRFAGGRPVADGRMKLTDRDLRKWGNSARPPQIEPERKPEQSVDRRALFTGQPSGVRLNERPVMKQNGELREKQRDEVRIDARTPQGGLQTGEGPRQRELVRQTETRQPQQQRYDTVRPVQRETFTREERQERRVETPVREGRQLPNTPVPSIGAPALQQQQRSQPARPVGEAFRASPPPVRTPQVGNSQQIQRAPSPPPAQPAPPVQRQGNDNSSRGDSTPPQRGNERVR